MVERKNLICIADDSGQTAENKTFKRPDELTNWKFLDEHDEWTYVNRVIVATSDDGDKEAIEKSDAVTFKQASEWLAENSTGPWTSVNVDIIGEGLTQEQRPPEMAVLWFCANESDAVGLKLFMESLQLVYPDEDIVKVRT